MLPDAYIVHQLPGRVRLRISGKRHDDAYFESAIEKLSTMSGLERFHSNRVSGCLVLHFDPELDWQDIATSLEAAELCRVVDAPPTRSPGPAMAPLLSGLGQVNQVISQGSGGRLDLRTTAYIGLLVLSIRQIMQGHVLGPALPMLLHAWSLADKFRFDPEQENAEPETETE
jgi:hypothetical protein